LKRECPRSRLGRRAIARAGRHVPPEASRIIFSIERGPRVVRMMSETAWVSERGGTGGQRRSFLRGCAERSLDRRRRRLTARSARGRRWRSPCADVKNAPSRRRCC
jgi:hypothetical protein